MGDLSPNVVFENGIRQYEAETKRAEMLSEARLRDMQTAKLEQGVINDRLSNVLKATSILEFQSSLNRWRKERDKRVREVERLSSFARNLSYYADGDRMPGLIRQNAWAAYRVFKRMAPSAVLREWQAATIDQGTALDPAYWIGRSIGGVDCSPSLPAVMPNRFSLIDWQDRWHQILVVRANTYPHLETLAAFESLTNAFATAAAKAEADIAALAKGEYDLWKLNDFVQLK